MNRRFWMAASMAALYLSAASAHALTTTTVEPRKLKEYAVTLAINASQFQWQQLWQATRKAGYFNKASGVHFTTGMPQVTDYVHGVLNQATEVTPYASTRATYRYAFTQEIGIVNKVAVKALCVDVDWRTLPPGTDTQDASKMGAVSLLLARPCR